MATILEVLDQGMTGVPYRLTPGIKIGRSNTDIKIQDVNVSSLHAIVELDNRNQLVLIDQDSANGLIINGRKVRKIALLPGVTFQIGKTLMRIKEVDEAEAERLVPLKNPRDKITEAFKNLAVVESHEEAKAPQFFNNYLEIEFVGGLDFGKTICLTYGPRTIGFLNLDIGLRDPLCPDFAFEIFETESKLVIKNVSSKGLLNNKEFESADITSGDILQIGTTQMKLLLKPYAF